jgi:pyruvate/2-oxoglutarate dehydrogenase complex dihydrolipoamide acyltransferase (E2) component
VSVQATVFDWVAITRKNIGSPGITGLPLVGTIRKCVSTGSVAVTAGDLAHVQISAMATRLHMIDPLGGTVSVGFIGSIGSSGSSGIIVAASQQGSQVSGS